MKRYLGPGQAMGNKFYFQFLSIAAKLQPKYMYSEESTLNRQAQILCGQAMPEYIIVLAILSFVLIVGPNSPLESLFTAFSEYYSRFSYASSRP